MRKLVAVFLLCLVFIGPQACGQEKDRPPSGLVLKPGIYSAKWEIPKPTRDSRLGSIVGWAKFYKERPSLKGKPKLASESPFYGYVRLETYGEPGREILFALDESKGTGKGYDTIYLDVNGNHDLSDDAQVSAKNIHQGGKYTRVEFTRVASIPVNKLFPGATNTNLVEMDIDVVHHVRDRGKSAESWGDVWLRGHWRGEVNTNKGKIPFRLADSSGNGRYDDRIALLGLPKKYQMGDQILFDWDANGKFPTALLSGPDPSIERYCFSSGVSIAGKLYALTTSPSGDKLKVARYTGPTARLSLKVLRVGKVPITLKGIRLAGSTGLYWLPLDGGSLQVPAGRYALNQVRLNARHRDGSDWSAIGIYGKPFTASAGKTVAVPVRPGVKMAIAPDSREVKLKRGKDVHIALDFALLSGGKVGGVFRTDSRSRPEATVSIKDANGKIVKTGKAGFG